MRFLKSCTAVGLMALATFSHAATITDPATIRLLASNCFQCHGTNGQDGTFSALAATGATDTFNKLKDMQTKNPRSSIMNPHAYGYSDDELRAIATYFSQQKGL